MNMQLIQCFDRANPIRLKIIQKKTDFSSFFYFQKKPKVFKNSQNLKIWLQKSKIGKPATQKLRMRIKYTRKLSIFCYV